MKTLRLLSTALAVTLLAFISLATADVPPIINYQGFLALPNGVGVTGDRDFQFSIWTLESGGVQKWGNEVHSCVEVKKGVFSVFLGTQGSPLLHTVFEEPDRWLEIAVGPCSGPFGSPLVPRTRLTTMPYAFRVATVDGATGGDIYGDLDLHSIYTVWGNPAYSNRFWRINQSIRSNITTSNDLVFKPGGSFAVVVQNPASGFFVGPSESNYILRVDMPNENVGIGVLAGFVPSAKLDVEVHSGGGAATFGDDANTATGTNAVAIGSDNQASGSNSFAVGTTNQTIGFTSAAIGDSNLVPGNISFAIGANDSVDGDYSGAIGADLAIAANYSHVIGHGVGALRLTNYIENSLMVGYSSDIPTLFVGPSSGAGTTGDVGIGTSTPSAKLDVEVVSGGAATIGNSTNTATGTNAVAMGGGNQAGGNNSFAVGSGNQATAGTSVAMGQNNIVTGVHSAAFLWANNVSGDNSFTIGANNSVDGEYSGAIGRDLAVSWVGGGGASHVIGRGASGITRLTNSIQNSLMVGYLSDIPTLFVGPSSGVGTTGDVGIGGITSPTEKLDVDGTARLRGIVAGGTMGVKVDASGVLFHDGSSRRYKTNIRELDINTKKVFELNPVRFQWKSTGDEDIGLIAEEVDEVISDLVIYDNEGRPEAVKYDRVAVYLLEVVKEQQKAIETLERKVKQTNNLTTGVSQMKSEIGQLKRLVQTLLAERTGSRDTSDKLTTTR